MSTPKCLKKYCVDDAVNGSLCEKHGGMKSFDSVADARARGVLMALTGLLDVAEYEQVDMSVFSDTGMSFTKFRDNVSNPYTLHSEERRAWRDGAASAQQMLWQAKIKIQTELLDG
jgi:hypothetical protein